MQHYIFMPAEWFKKIDGNFSSNFFATWRSRETLNYSELP